jgi:hypothetical protein
MNWLWLLTYPGVGLIVMWSLLADDYNNRKTDIFWPHESMWNTKEMTKAAIMNTTIGLFLWPFALVEWICKRTQGL